MNVIGEVNNSPGRLELMANTPLLQAILAAAGLKDWLASGGNVELVDIEDGIVKLRLVGACSSCSSSSMTLKMGIVRALKKAIPMVRCIEAVE